MKDSGQRERTPPKWKGNITTIKTRVTARPLSQEAGNWPKKVGASRGCNYAAALLPGNVCHLNQRDWDGTPRGGSVKSQISRSGRSFGSGDSHPGETWDEKGISTLINRGVSMTARALGRPAGTHCFKARTLYASSFNDCFGRCKTGIDRVPNDA